MHTNYHADQNHVKLEINFRPKQKSEKAELIMLILRDLTTGKLSFLTEKVWLSLNSVTKANKCERTRGQALHLVHFNKPLLMTKYCYFFALLKNSKPILSDNNILQFFITLTQKSFAKKKRKRRHLLVQKSSSLRIKDFT